VTIKVDLNSKENVQLDQLSEGIQELNRMSMDAGLPPQVFVSKDGQLCSITDTGDLVDLTEASLATLIRVIVEPGRFKADKDDPSTPVWKEEPKIPRDLIRSYIETHRWVGIPRIKAVSRAPIVRPDFSIRWEPGWDELTSCWVTEGLKRDVSLLERQPTADDARGPMDIRDAFKVFPFIDDRLVADALAAAFTPLLTTAITAPVPSMIVSARKVASGKTELAKTCSILGNGGKTITTWRGSTELEKMIQTYVKEDKRAIIFDNIKNDIDSTIMESVITSRRISYRRLYTQLSADLQSNTTWFMTANGAIVSEDMIRRSIVIMLDRDAPGAPTWDDTFTRSIELMESALVTIMCDMIEKWRDAGCPGGSVVFSNFEEWSVVVSGILEHAGITGMWEARDEVIGEAIQSDDEDEAPVVEAIAYIMGEDEWAATELWEKVNDLSGVLDPKIMFVKEWLTQTAKNSGKNKGIAVGRALHKLIGKTYDGCNVQLDSHKVHNRKIYSCKSLDGAPLNTQPVSQGGPGAKF
jgi:hypothetical protein